MDLLLAISPLILLVALSVITRDCLISLVVALALAAYLAIPESAGLVDRLWQAGHIFCDDFLIQPLDSDRMKVLAFTLCMAGMVAVMEASGSIDAIGAVVSRWATTRAHGQICAVVVGFLVFFDDYANTFVMGASLRGLTAKLRISPEKLAFLIDSTAAPIAGLALFSTWSGTELQAIEAGLADLPDSGGFTSFGLLVGSIPYRFYPIVMLAFVSTIALTGRDYGPMRRVESDFARAIAAGADLGSRDETKITSVWQIPAFVIPLVLLLASMALILWTSGLSESPEENSFSAVLTRSDPTHAVYVASLVGSVAAVVTGRMFSGKPVTELFARWTAGAKGILESLLVLILAWSLAAAFSSDYLNLADKLAAVLPEGGMGRFTPGAVFVMSALIAFSIGSSWATMTVMMAIAIRLQWEASPAEGLNADVVYATVGSVLSGSILGDHCSMVSDTTVMSSIAAGVDNYRHFITQLLYALSAGGSVIVVGYGLFGLGFSLWLSLGAATVAAVALVFLFGRRIEAA